MNRKGPRRSKYPNTRVVGHKYHSDYSIWGLKPHDLGTRKCAAMTTFLKRMPKKGCRSSNSPEGSQLPK